MQSPHNHVMRVGAWRVDPTLDEISKDGTSVKLEPRTMQLLVCLAEHAGEVVSVEQLLEQVWKDVVVTPNSVYHAIAELRRVLGDDPKEPSYIVNVLRRGYRLVAPVSSWVDAPAVPEANSPATTSTETTAPPTTAATGSPFRRSGIALLVVLALLLAYLAAARFWLSKPITAEHPATAATRAVADKSIAVLPFIDMSEKKDQEYFADGMAEEIIGLLSKVPDLHVPARTSSFYFKGKQTTIADIATALGVAHVLEGSVRKSGNTVRITAQLVRVDNGYHVWSETFDRQLDDIFKIQDEIAGAVVKSLKASLLEGEVPRSTPTTNTEAYTLYLQARSVAIGRASEADYRAAINYLQQAVTLDPMFASAWAALANIFLDEVSWSFTFSPRYQEFRARAHKAADQALRLDAKLSDGHLAMAKILFFDGDWSASELEFERAEVDPGNADALRWNSYLAFMLKRFDQALELAQRAASHDPLNSWNFHAVAAALSAKGRFTESEAAYRKALELNPTGVGLHALLGHVLLANGKPAAALAEMERETDDAWRQLSVPFALDALGRQGEADSAVTALEEQYGAQAPSLIAYFYACRKDADRAIMWFDRSIRQHNIEDSVTASFCMKNLDPDPRYKALLRKMKLPD